MSSLQSAHTVFGQDASSVDLRLLDAIFDVLDQLNKITEQEWIPVGCVPSTAALISAQRDVCRGGVSARGVSAPGVVCPGGCLPVGGLSGGGAARVVCLGAVFARHPL